MRTDWNFVLDTVADEIIYHLEGDLLSRKGLGNEFDALDNATVSEIRDIWKTIILEKLRSILPFPPNEELHDDETIIDED